MGITAVKWPQGVRIVHFCNKHIGDSLQSVVTYDTAPSRVQADPVSGAYRGPKKKNRKIKAINVS